MNALVSIGEAPWSRKDALERLEEFSTLYKSRPIEDNTGGMLTPHMFWAWFMLKTLQPKAIIESGVWLGQGTWFFEQACPEAQLYCIDVKLSQIRYRSNRAKYFDHDFATIDWNHLPKDETIVFLDDHQNAYERLKTAKWFGFRHLIFEDNYPSSQGDCYSLKKAFMHTGLTKIPPHRRSIMGKIKLKAKTLLGVAAHQFGNVPPNAVDAAYLTRNLEVYYECPPILKPTHTRWNDLWDSENYPTPDPLLTKTEHEYEQIYKDEATSYTWICYTRLK